jgi:hypothetical protein
VFGAPVVSDSTCSVDVSDGEAVVAEASLGAFPASADGTSVTATSVYAAVVAESVDSAVVLGAAVVSEPTCSVEVSDGEAVVRASIVVVAFGNAVVVVVSDSVLVDSMRGTAVVVAFGTDRFARISYKADILS